MAAPFAAALRLFATPEMLEQILLGVAHTSNAPGGQGDLPPGIVTLHNCRRVSRDFANTIAGSAKLRRELRLLCSSSPASLASAQDAHAPIDWLVKRLGLWDDDFISIVALVNNAGAYVFKADKIDYDMIQACVDRYITAHPKTFSHPEASWRNFKASLSQSPDRITFILPFRYRNGESPLITITVHFDQNTTLGEVYDRWMAVMDAYLVPALSYDNNGRYNRNQRDSVAMRVWRELRDLQRTDGRRTNDNDNDTIHTTYMQPAGSKRDRANARKRRRRNKANRA